MIYIIACNVWKNSSAQHFRITCLFIIFFHILVFFSFPFSSPLKSIMHSTQKSSSKRTSQSSAPREILALRPPKTPYAYSLWRFKLWMGTTFSTCVMETWEVYVIFSFFITFFLLVLAGSYRYVSGQATDFIKLGHPHFISLIGF